LNRLELGIITTQTELGADPDLAVAAFRDYGSAPLPERAIRKWNQLAALPIEQSPLDRSDPDATSCTLAEGQGYAKALVKESFEGFSLYPSAQSANRPCPNRAIRGFQDRSRIQVCHRPFCVLHGGEVLTIEEAKTASIDAEPEATVPGRATTPDFVASGLRRRYPKNLEFKTIKANQPFLGTKPNVAIFRLSNSCDGVGGQTILTRPALAIELKDGLRGIQRKQGSSRQEEEACSRHLPPIHHRQAQANGLHFPVHRHN
jgi:hypothetical protein